MVEKKPQLKLIITPLGKLDKIITEHLATLSPEERTRRIEAAHKYSTELKKRKDGKD